MRARAPLWLAGALAVACGSHAAAPDAAAIDAASDAAGPDAPLGSAGTVGLYEAEAGVLTGGAAIVGTPDGSDRAIGDLGGEASGRQAVTLAQPGAAVAFTVLPAHAGATGVVIRFSLPDAAAGGGQAGPLALTVTAPGRAPVTRTFTLTSRYAWLYGSGPAGTKLYNAPANAATFAGSTAPTHLYDEAQLLLAEPLLAGATVALALPAGATLPVTIDFLELEIVGPPLAAPSGYLAITDPACGAIALDTHGTGQAFDGVDDAAYASVWTAGSGINPFNPTGSNGVQPAGTQEKDYYSSGSADALQDGAPTAASPALGLFALADHNLQSLVTCLGLTTAGSGAYAGVWIPPGRYYVRGSLALPSHARVQGAGMWFSKLVAVDTAPPIAVTNPGTGLAGIASQSGDLRLVPASGSAADVRVSDLAVFGNATQRDVVDHPAPVGVVGAFSGSTFARLWFEHVSQGIVMNGSAAGDTLDHLRARDTFADGIDFYGDTSASVMADCSARGTGDDGFAIWSQSGSGVSSGNSLVRSEASLQWFGNGLAVYGGTNITLADDRAADVLTGAGMKLATEFVPPALPATFTMTGIAVRDTALVRCGGTAFAEANPAVLVGAMDEAIAGMTLDHLTITSPTSGAFAFRVLSNVGAISSPGAVSGVVITSSEVIGAPACGAVAAGVHGDVALDDVCVCAAAGGAAASCAMAEQGSAFAITASTCARAACGP